MQTRFCRRTTLPKASTTLPRRCRCHPHSLSSTSSLLASLPSKPSGGRTRRPAAGRSARNAERKSVPGSDDELHMILHGGGQDRQYRVNSFQLLGPFGASGLGSTPTRERIFSCHPDKTDAQATCAKQIIRSIATRAYRRPISD